MQERRNQMTKKIIDEDLELSNLVHSLLTQPEGSSTAQAKLLKLCENRPFELDNKRVLAVFVDGLNNGEEYVKFRAALCLAHLAKNDVGMRDRILEQEGLLAALKASIECPKFVSFGQSCVALIISFLSHEKMPPSLVAREWVTFLSYLMIDLDPEEDNFDLLLETTRAVYLYSKYPDVEFEKSIVSKLVKCLGHKNFDLVEPALMALGNATNSSAKSIQDALDAGVLQNLKRLLENERTQASACILLASIAAGTPEQARMLFKYPFRQVFRQVADLIYGKHPMSLKAKAIDVIVTVIRSGADGHIIMMMELCCVAALCEALQFTSEVNILKPILDGLRIVLDLSSRIDLYYDERILNCGVVSRLEELQKHSSSMVRNMSFVILQKYFSNREDAPDARAARFDDDEMPRGNFIRT